MNKLNQAQEKFREDFPERERPYSLLLLPRTFSQLSSEQLSDVMAKYTHWREYTEDLIVDAFVALTQAKTKYDSEYYKQYATISAKNKEEREAKVFTVSEVEKANQEYIKCSMYHDLLGNKLQGIKDTISTISREITRRGLME